jgi:hypothetical protein
MLLRIGLGPLKIAGCCKEPIGLRLCKGAAVATIVNFTAIDDHYVLRLMS